MTCSSLSRASGTLDGAEGKKVYEVHFRLPAGDGKRLLDLVERLQTDQSSVARDALSLFLQLAESAPISLTGPRLAVFLLDRVAQVLDEPDPPEPSDKKKKRK